MLNHRHIRLCYSHRLKRIFKDSLLANDWCFDLPEQLQKYELPTTQAVNNREGFR